MMYGLRTIDSEDETVSVASNMLVYQQRTSVCAHLSLTSSDVLDRSLY